MNKLTYLKTSILTSYLYMNTGFNSTEAINLVKTYTDPLTTFLLWAVPIVGIIAAVASSVGYLLKDEEERDRHRYTSTLKKILIAAIIGECMVTIFKIFGISTS